MTNSEPWTAPAWEELSTDGKGTVDDRATELANAEELHRLYRAYLRYHVDRGEYYVWAETHWHRDIDGQVCPIFYSVVPELSVAQ
jgi:hypothetical protein